MAETDGSGNPGNYVLYSAYRLMSIFVLEPLRATWVFFRKVGTSLFRDSGYPKLPLNWVAATWNYPTLADNYCGKSEPFTPPPYPDPPTPQLDTEDPVVTGFVASDSNNPGLTISTFTATDNVRVIAYLITESPTPPTYDSGWYPDPYDRYVITGELLPRYDIVRDEAGYVLSYKCDKTLYAWAMDASGNISSAASDATTISMSRVSRNDEWPTAQPLPNPPEKVAPSVGSFTMVTHESAGRVVGITSFTGSSWCGISGFAIREVNNPPEVTSAEWKATAPTSYTFSGVGECVAYAWVKDNADQISASKAWPVTVTLENSDTLAGVELGIYEIPGLNSQTEARLKYAVYPQVWQTWDLGQWNYQAYYGVGGDYGSDREAIALITTLSTNPNDYNYILPYMNFLYLDDGRVVIQQVHRSLEHMKYSGIPDYSKAYPDYPANNPPIGLNGSPPDNGKIYYCDGSSAVYTGNNKVLFTVSFGANVFGGVWAHQTTDHPEQFYSNGVEPIFNHGYPFYYYVIVNEIPNLDPCDLVWYLSESGYLFGQSYVSEGRQVLVYDEGGNIINFPSNAYQWTTGTTPSLFYLTPQEWEDMCLAQAPTALSKLVQRKRQQSVSSSIHTAGFIRGQPFYEKTVAYWQVVTHGYTHPNPPYVWVRTDDTLEDTTLKYDGPIVYQSYEGWTEHPTQPHGGFGGIAVCEGTVGANGGEILIDRVVSSYVSGTRARCNTSMISFVPRKTGYIGGYTYSFNTSIKHPTVDIWSASLKLTKALSPTFILGTMTGPPDAQEHTADFYITHDWGYAPPWSISTGDSFRDAYPAQTQSCTWKDQYYGSQNITVGVYSLDGGVTWNEFTPLSGMTREQTPQLAQLYPYGGNKGLIVWNNDLIMMTGNSPTTLEPLGYDDAGDQIDISGNVTSIQIGTYNTTGQVLITLAHTPPAGSQTKTFMSKDATTIETYGAPIESVTKVECMDASNREWVSGAATVTGADQNVVTVTNALPKANTVVRITFTYKAAGLTRLVLVSDFGSYCYHAGWVSSLTSPIKAYTFTGGGLDTFMVDPELPKYEPPLAPPDLSITGQNWTAYRGIADCFQVPTRYGYFPYSFEVTSGALPDGMALGPTGLIEGTPTSSGSYSFTIRATDSRVNTASAGFQIEVI